MVEETGVVNYIVMFWTILLIGYYIQCEWESKQMEKVAEYEENFYDHHQDAINLQQQNPNSVEAIPLTFQRQQVDDLRHLCVHYKSKWTPQHYMNKWITLRSFTPTLEENYIRLRRLAVARRHPIRVVTIRCSEHIAIIEAGDNRSGYVLAKDESDQSRMMSVFNIIGKFTYEQPARRINTEMEPMFVVGGQPERYPTRRNTHTEK